MATLATRDDDQVEVVSGDRDMLALATDRVHRALRGRGHWQRWRILGPAEVLAKYGVPAGALRRLRGAARRPQRRAARGRGRRREDRGAWSAGSAPSRTSSLPRDSGDDGFPAGAAGRVRAARDYLAVAPAAVRGRTDAPVDEVDDALRLEPADPARLARLVEELGIGSSIERVQRAVAAAITG